MDWDELFDIEEEWETTLRSPGDLGPQQTPAYFAARKRRVAKLKAEVEAGIYFLVPADMVAECIVEGKPKWGEALIDEDGNRVDEWWKERMEWKEWNEKYVGILVALALVGCTTDADMASHNLSQAAEQFEIDRRVVFFNGITDTYLLSIEGRCSIEDQINQLEVTCKIGPDAFKKHFLGLSDNVSYFVEQLESADVSVYHYRVIFKPQTIIPDIDFEGDISLPHETRGGDGTDPFAPPEEG